MSESMKGKKNLRRRPCTGLRERRRPCRPCTVARADEIAATAPGKQRLRAGGSSGRATAPGGRRATSGGRRRRGSGEEGGGEVAARKGAARKEVAW
jgi:hypothetical protein